MAPGDVATACTDVAYPAPTSRPGPIAAAGGPAPRGAPYGSRPGRNRPNHPPDATKADVKSSS